MPSLYKFLDKITINKRLSLTIVLCSFFSFIISTFIISWSTTENLYREKAAKVSQITELSINLLKEYEDRVDSKELTLADAQFRAKKRIGRMRYDNLRGYIWIQDYNNKILMHPITPDLTGTDWTNKTDGDGKKVIQEMTKAAREKGFGEIQYSWPKPDVNDNKVYPKISYVRNFPQWQWIVGTGVYTDDINAEVIKYVLICTFLEFLAALLVIIIVNAAMAKSITSPLKKLADISMKLAHGDLVEVPDDTNPTEIGDLNRSFKKFAEFFKKMKRDELKIIETLNMIRDKDDLQGLIMESTENGYILFDNAGNIILTNDAFFEMFELSEDARNTSSGMGIRNVIAETMLEPRLFVDNTIRIFQTLNKEKDFYELKNGKIIERYTLPLFKNGTQIGRLCNFRDITVRKNVEKDLQLKDKLLSAVAEATSALVRHMDFDKAVTQAFNIVGNAINVDKIFLFENKLDVENDKLTSVYRNEWVSDKKYSRINDDVFKNFSYTEIPELVKILYEKRKPLIANVDNLEPVTRKILAGINVKSIMLFPIYLNDFFWGFIGFEDCKNERIWSESEKAILLSFASSLESLVERKRNIEEEEQASEKERVLRQIVETIRTSLDINEIKSSIVNVVGKFFNSDRCYIYEYIPNKKDMFEIHTEYLSSQNIKSMLSHNIIDLAKDFVIKIKNGQNNIIKDSEKFIEENLENNPLTIKFIEDFEIKSDYGFGIFYKNVYYGGLVIHYVEDKKFLDDEELKFMELIVNQIGVALYQAELYKKQKQLAENESTLRKIITTIRGSLYIEEILTFICEEIGKQFNVQVSSISELDSNRTEGFRLRKEYKNSPDIKGFADSEYNFKTYSYNAEIIKEGKNLIIENINESELPDFYKNTYSDLGVKSLLCLPIEKDEDKWGTVCLFDYDNYRYWAEDEINLLKSITDQVYIAIKQAQLYSIIEENEKRLQFTLDSMIDGHITTDSEGMIQSCNPAIEKVFGYNLEELQFKSIDEILTPKIFNPDSGDELVYTAEKFEMTGTGKYGREIPLKVSISEIYYDNEIHFSFVMSDISKEKEVERLKNEFISTVSHELRTPLTAIRGSLGLISSGIMGEVPDGANNLIQMANNNCLRLINLINDILDVEKIESGKMTFYYEKLEILPIIKRAIYENKPYAEQFNVNIVLDNQLSNEKSMLDKDRFLQVITNLLSNAIKFSPAGETVSVRCYKNDNGEIIISVKDNGPGIPDEFKDVIFQKFAQADSSSTRQKGGTGLGLNISKAIIEKMNGNISFNAEIEEGTTFFIKIPALDESSQPIEKAPKVLICDKNHDSASLVSILISGNGYATHISHNADETKDLLIHNDYSAIIIDTGLCDDQTIPFIKEIKTNDKTRLLPLLILSSEENKENESQTKTLPFTSWLYKPIEEAKLLSSIKILVSKRNNNFPNILHVEDDLVSLGIVETVLKNVANISRATTLKEAKEKILNEHCDLLLLDLTLPDGSGLELLTLLEKHNKKIPTVIFSASDIDKDLYKKVDSVLLKSSSSRQNLLELIKSVTVKPDGV